MAAKKKGAKKAAKATPKKGAKKTRKEAAQKSHGRAGKRTSGPAKKQPQRLPARSGEAVAVVDYEETVVVMEAPGDSDE